MKIDKDIFRRSRELLRQIANYKYEQTDNGIFIAGHGLIGGSMIHTVNGLDRRVDDNTWTIEGLNYLLNTGFNRSAAASAFYVAPFSGNVTPASSLTAATFTSTLTEATGYSESTRIEFVDAAASSGSTNNSSNRAEMTANTDVTVWGAGLLSVSTKSSTSGVCLAAAKFSAARVLASSDVLAFDYTLTITPT